MVSKSLSVFNCPVSQWRVPPLLRVRALHRVPARSHRADRLADLRVHPGEEADDHVRILRAEIGDNALSCLHLAPLQPGMLLQASPKVKAGRGSPGASVRIRENRLPDYLLAYPRIRLPRILQPSLRGLGLRDL